KIFAAFLVAGIVACFTGFLAEHAVAPQDVAAHGAEAAADGGSAAAAAPAQPEPVLALIAAADVEQGKKLSKACATCHNFDKGGPNGVGPNLWNVLNRGRAKAPGFSYSDDMTAKGGSWNYADLNHFLWKPRSFVPGTKMTFAGLKKPEDRASIM